MKCHVKDCENHDHQGLFIGIVCSPCYEFLSIGRGKHSQLYRNTVAAEREACAKMCEAEGERVDASWVSCAFAIRERGAP
jgi:hypothetical protein